MKSNTLSKVDLKLIDIPNGDFCGSQQIGNTNLFKLSSQILPSSSSDSSSSNSTSERLVVNMKIRNALTITLTPECEDINVDCTSYNLLNNSDANKSGFTQILEEEEFEPENGINTIFNVVDFNKRLSYFLLKYNKSLN